MGLLAVSKEGGKHKPLSVENWLNKLSSVIVVECSPVIKMNKADVYVNM